MPHGFVQVNNIPVEAEAVPQQEDPSLAFREGDLVLRRIQKSDGQHKLSSPWEGPFVVGRALKNNAYYLIDCRKSTRYVDTSGQETEHPWNVEQLCPFYS